MKSGCYAAKAAGYNYRSARALRLKRLLLHTLSVTDPDPRVRVSSPVMVEGERAVFLLTGSRDALPAAEDKITPALHQRHAGESVSAIGVHRNMQHAARD